MRKMNQKHHNVGIAWVYYVNEWNEDFWKVLFTNAVIVPVKVLGLPKGAEVEV